MKTSYANSGKQNKLLRGLTCLLLVTALLMLSGCSSLTYKVHHEEVKQHMEAYLKERYGIDFEVKPYLFESAFWSNSTYWEAEAHPAGQPEMQFKVQGSKGAESINYQCDDDKYTDDYLKGKWSYQAQQEIEKKLREVYGPDVDFNIRKCEFRGGNYALKDLDFAQVFEKIHGNGGMYLVYDVFIDGAKFDKKIEAKKTYQIMKCFILDLGGHSSTFEVTYVDKVCKQDYLSDDKPYVDNWSVHHGGFHKSNEYEEKIADKKLLNYFSWNNYSEKHTVIENEKDFIKVFDY